MSGGELASCGAPGLVVGVVSPATTFTRSAHAVVALTTFPPFLSVETQDELAHSRRKVSLLTRRERAGFVSVWAAGWALCHRAIHRHPSRKTLGRPETDACTCQFDQVGFQRPRAAGSRASTQSPSLTAECSST